MIQYLNIYVESVDKSIAFAKKKKNNSTYLVFHEYFMFLITDTVVVVEVGMLNGVAESSL